MHNLGDRHQGDNDISNFRQKKALFVIKYLDFDGQVIKCDGSIGTNKKDDLGIMPSDIDEFLKVVNALKTGQDIPSKGIEPVLPLFDRIKYKWQ